ncbi:hypothetical protein CDAR_28541 [Caerostris darwini]|uniref:Uncharacterized protein n=1 Tax=Caerostris darwini TaxID=1538125 RepID=A0AAV4Q338_9ARAC|nr:hypothetical protein CDAR_28541 [Caerostris darwini]
MKLLLVERYFVKNHWENIRPFELSTNANNLSFHLFIQHSLSGISPLKVAMETKGTAIMAKQTQFRFVGETSAGSRFCESTSLQAEAIRKGKKSFYR